MLECPMKDCRIHARRDHQRRKGVATLVRRDPFKTRLPPRLVCSRLKLLRIEGPHARGAETSVRANPAGTR
jgi:hypothetical protein